MKTNMRAQSMYWLYNVLLLVYWATLIPMLIYRLIRKKAFISASNRASGFCRMI